MSLVIAVFLMEATIWFFANQNPSEPIQRSINLFWTAAVVTFLTATVSIGYSLMAVQPLYDMMPLYMFCIMNLTVALSISTLMKHCPAQ